MKTAILQCLQQFSSENNKNVYHDQILKKSNLKKIANLKVYGNLNASVHISSRNHGTLFWASRCSCISLLQVHEGGGGGGI